MKKLIVCVTFAALVMVPTLQAGEKDCSSCSTQAVAACSGSKAVAKAACGAKKIAKRNHQVKGAMLLARR